MFRRPYTSTPKTRSVRIEGPWLHDVHLVRVPTGRTMVRIDGEVYEYGGWFNLPLTGGEVEALYQAILQAEQRLQAEEAGLPKPAPVQNKEPA